MNRYSLKISINVTSCNAVTVPPHDVIQKKMTPWVQLTDVGTWPHDRGGRCGYSGERPPHTVIGQVRLPGWWGAKEGKKHVGFSFPLIRIQSTLFHIFILPDKSHQVIMVFTIKK